MLSLYEVLELEKKWEEYNQQRQKSNPALASIKSKICDFYHNTSKTKIVVALAALVFVLLIVVVILSLSGSKSTSNQNQATHHANSAKYPSATRADTGNNVTYNNTSNSAEKISQQAKFIQQEKEKIQLKNINKQEQEQDTNAIDPQYQITKSTLLLPQTIEIKETYAPKETPRQSLINPAKDISVDNVEPAQEQAQRQEPKIVQTSNALITVSNASVNIDDLIEYFQKHPNAANAVKVSRAYFSNDDYNNARIWALKANSLDKDNEESWILFAKSNYKLGNKDDAIKVLNDYLKFNPSQQAKELLTSMQQGIL